jgi:hypothetical protein
MSHSSKRRSTRSGHRKYRQKIDLKDAVIAGDSRLPIIVYCYRFPSRPERIKIGYSSRGLTRIAEQSTSFPEKPEVLFVIHNKRAKEIEAAFHEALSSRQSDVVGTEWFDAGWKDILAVSPILRKAAGKNTLRRWLQVALYTLLGGASLALYAPLAVSQIALAQGVPVSSLASIWTGWFGVLTSYDIGSSVGMFRAMVEAAWRFPMFWGFKLLPVAAAAAPLGLPAALSRRQAF